MTIMTRHECVHIIRNPDGHSDETQREAALFVCDEVEIMEKLFEEMRRHLVEEAGEQ